jgi:hypothetical protein
MFSRIEIYDSEQFEYAIRKIDISKFMPSEG